MHEMGVENNDWHPFIIDIDKVVAAKNFHNDGERTICQLPSLPEARICVDKSFTKLNTY
jgi:hypothetical protein